MMLKDTASGRSQQAKGPSGIKEGRTGRREGAVGSPWDEWADPTLAGLCQMNGILVPPHQHALR